MCSSSSATLTSLGKQRSTTRTVPSLASHTLPRLAPCPLRQAWGSLDALIGCLRAAFEENCGPPEANPFGSHAVRLYLREVRDSLSKARGVSYEKKRKRVNRLKTLTQTQPPLQLQQQQEQLPQQQGQTMMANYSGATV
ncbi:hypothetical protein Bca4012_065048 [Brassica carinata]|uniref:ALOG domain-containing protein n=1 Tax=Brassica carinata TaxID=52824 RepID=A0A8X8AWD6_BRACI|nr:hypothetical protein Bca52824_017502 [Brassica carinata]